MTKRVDNMEIQHVIGGWIVWDTKQHRRINGPFAFRWMAVVARFFSVGLAR